MNNIKVKIWEIIYLTKKQFLVMYGLLGGAFFILAVLSFYFDETENIRFSLDMPFFSTASGLMWLFFLFMTVTEGQFYWNRFAKAQLKIIEKQKAEIIEKNEELFQQQEEILVQKHQIEKSHQQITDSINYAQRIQRAVMQPDDSFKPGELMVYFNPREAVSGDFYYIKIVQDFKIYVVADCTGHGVPGAFMSMLGIAFLHEIIQKQIFEPSAILEELRKMVKNSLHQTGQSNEQKDGMDIAICVLDEKNKSLKYSGANNPLYFIRNGQLEVYKATRNPIGIYLKEKPFTQTEISYAKGDMFYIFSDGYPDQLGGEKPEKLKYSRFRQFIENVHEQEFSKQKEAFHQNLLTWMGNNEQIDDILIMGVRL